MYAFFKLLRFILFTFSLFFTLNSTAQNHCKRTFSLFQNKKLVKSSIGNAKSIINSFNWRAFSRESIESEAGGIRVPRPRKPLNTNKSERPTKTKHDVTLRKAYNRGFFKEDERYILPQNIINNGFSPARIKSFQRNSLVIEEVDMDGNIIERTIPSSLLSRFSAHPIAISFFKSLDNQLAEVEPIQYPQVNKEAQMRKQGFKNEMFQGLDTAYEMTDLANHLRQSKVNPYETHIADFSDQIPERIRFIREGLEGNIEGNNFSEKSELLNKLALEAVKRQQEKRVTYAWWLIWNYKLISLLGVKNYNQLYRQNNTSIYSLIQAFPDFVVLPILEDLGAMAINKLISENTFPLGLVNQTTFADGQESQPTYFFYHDALHAQRILQSHVDNNNFPYGTSSSMTTKELYEKIQSLPTTQQQQAEFIYFFITHEKGLLYDDMNMATFFGNVYQATQKDDSFSHLIPEQNRQSVEKTISYIRAAESVYKNLLRE